MKLAATRNNARSILAVTLVLSSASESALRASGILDLPGDRRVDTSDVIRLKDHPRAGQIFAQVGAAVGAVDIDVALIGGDEFEVNNCLGIKASAGVFQLKLGTPTIDIGLDDVKLAFSIDKITLTALNVKVKPKNLFDCGYTDAFGVGGSAKDIKLTVSMNPSVKLGLCTVVSLGAFDARVSIGSVDLSGVPSELDNVAKKMVQEAANFTFHSILPDFLKTQIGASFVAGGFCQTAVDLYKVYMGILGAGVKLFDLPERYIDALQPFYPTVDLHTVKFGFSDRQPANNNTTDCNRIYFSNPGYVDRLRHGALTADDDWSLLFHELQHTEQCASLGNRDAFAAMWFEDLALSALVLNLAHPESFYDDLHDNMPMEGDADARAATMLAVLGPVEDAESGEAVPDVEVTAFAAATPVSGSTPEVARSVSGSGGYLLVLEPGTYDLYVRPLGATERALAKDGVVTEAGDWAQKVTLEISTDVEQNAGQLFVRGDSNSSGTTNMSDALHVLAWLFSNGSPPVCPKAADVNDDGRVDISDPLALLGYLFLGAHEPPAPFPAAGVDPTPDALTCG